MAEIGAKPHLVATLNGLVASQTRKEPRDRLTTMEIAQIVLAMAETAARLAAEPSPPLPEANAWRPTPNRVL